MLSVPAGETAPLHFSIQDTPHHHLSSITLCSYCCCCCRCRCLTPLSAHPCTSALRSITPTFAACAVFVNNARWDGVPFLLKAGKALASRVAEIRVQFRHVPGNLYRNKLGLDLDKATNELVSGVEGKGRVQGGAGAGRADGQVDGFTSHATKINDKQTNKQTWNNQT